MDEKEIDSGTFHLLRPTVAAANIGQGVNQMDWQQHIHVDSAICKGRACVAGTRITVSSVLDNLAEGMTVDAIAASYPPLTADDIHACIVYAAALTHEELVPLKSNVPESNSFRLSGLAQP